MKTIQKLREGSDDESTHTENRALETVVTRAEGGLRDEIEGVPVPVGGAAPRNACLETDFIKPRNEFRAEFVLQILHLGWKRRKTNRLIKVMFS